ncbi:MAG: hypothetical protein ACU836_00005, partial [Gammaproteobacteria bacterium]
DGIIDGKATAKNGDLTNTGTIGTDKLNHYAQATGNLVNSGRIKGHVKTQANLINNGSIETSATLVAGTVNRIEVDGNIDNYGLISVDGTGNGIVSAGKNMLISGANAELAFTNSGLAKVDIGGTLTIDEGGKVSFANAGQATVSVNEDLTLGLNGTGVIERIGANTDEFIVDPINPGSNLTVQNPGSKIVDNRPQGDMLVMANDTISILNGGEISREASINTDSQLILYAQHLVMQGSKIFSSGTFNMAPGPDVTVLDIQKKSIFPLDLTFIGSGSSLTATANFGIDGNVFYTLPVGQPYGNAIVSISGKLFIEPDNLQAIQRNGRNVGGPYIEDGTTSNSYNYYGNGFRSNQAGNLQSMALGVISKPADLPAVPPDPCGSGSTLEIKHSNGVIPTGGDLASFSVFPEEHSNEEAHEVDNQTSDGAPTTQAKNESCNNG